MNTHFLTRVRRIFNSGHPINDRHNQRSWVRSVRFLGPRWLLATPLTRSRT